MKIGRKITALVLTLVMLVNSLFIGGFNKASAANTNYEKAFHLDCGRKYFSKNWIKALINEMAADGYTHLQLAFGNDGLRFLLDDMSVTANNTVYSNADVTNGVKQGNISYNNANSYNPPVNELTQAEMDEILVHAKAMNIEIVPHFNMPGHMDATLKAMESLGLNAHFTGYNKSVRSLNINDNASVAFAKALLKKYVDYFAQKGSKHFNIGADEFGNDAYGSGAMGFESMDINTYLKFQDFVNQSAQIVKTAGMTPRAWNDGMYYQKFANNKNVKFDSSIEIAYWSSGWSTYKVASSGTLSQKGHKIINTHGDFYYVLGKNDNFDNGYTYAGNFANNKLADGNTGVAPVGSMFCVWADFPNAETETEIARKIRLPMRAMADAMDEPSSYNVNMDKAVIKGGFNEDGTINVSAPDVPVDPGVDESKLVTLTNGGVTVTGYDLTSLEAISAQAPTVDFAKNISAYRVTPKDKNGVYAQSATISIPIPQGYNKESMCAYTVNKDGSISPIVGKIENGNYVYQCSGFPVVTGLIDSKDGRIFLGVGENKVIEEKGSATALSQSDVHFDGNIADVKVESVPITTQDKTEYLLGGRIAKKKIPAGNYVIASTTNALSLNGTSVANNVLPSVTKGTKIELSSSWKIEPDGKGYVIYQQVGNDKYYLGYNTSNTPGFLGGDYGYSLAIVKGTKTVWNIAFDKPNNYSIYLNLPVSKGFFGKITNGNVYVSKNWGMVNENKVLHEIYSAETNVIKGKTTYDNKITFTGKNVGEVSGTVGSVPYTVIVGVGNQDVTVFVNDMVTLEQSGNITGEPVYSNPGIVSVQTTGNSVVFRALKEGFTKVTIGNICYNVRVVYRVKNITVNRGTSYTDTQSEPIVGSTYEDEIVKAVPNGNDVVFYGKKDGKTTVKMGNTEYNITVSNIDLKSKKLEIEHWITNRPVVPQGVESVQHKNTDGVVDMVTTTIDASFPGIYSENGVVYKDICPEYGLTVENAKTYRWILSYHDKQHFQTSGNGSDETGTGLVMLYIRYWNDEWAYKGNQDDLWHTIDTNRNEHRIVGYYLAMSEASNEVYPLMKDWPILYKEWQAGGADWFFNSYVQNNGKFVFLDLEVVYPDGTRTPKAFPNDYTAFYHFDGFSSSNPRKLGNIFFKVNDRYNVTKITVQEGTASVGRGYADFKVNYTGKEKEVWNKSTETNRNVPQVPDVQFTKGGVGKKVIVYVEEKPHEEKLSVHYIDELTNTEFYNYNISTNQGVFFDPNIKLDTTTPNTVLNNTVTSTTGLTQTVNADLKTMPNISGIYRYNNYSCIRLERSQDGKHVYLYYMFSPRHQLVADFGLPIEIKASDLGIDLGYSAECTKPNYGTVKIDNASGKMTYTPNGVLPKADIMFLLVTSKGPDGQPELDANGDRVIVTNEIIIYPASTIYYEEGYMTPIKGFAGGSKGTKVQETHLAADINNIYGFDSAYSNETGISNGTEAVSKNAGDKGTINFTGTGIDIYLNCSPNSGLAAIMLRNISTGRFVKFMQIDTAMKKGTTSATEGQQIDAFGLPVVSLRDLPHSNYEVTILHLGRKPGEVGGDIRIDGFRIHNTLNSLNGSEYLPAEHNPNFVELRDTVLSGFAESADTQSIYKKADGFISQVYANAGTLVGSVVVSNNPNYQDKLQLQDLLDNGPKNELFLYTNQAITFNLGSNKAQIGLKAVNGKVNYEVNGKAYSVTTSTDMFYHSGLTGEVTITNKSGGILSLTVLKVFTSAPKPRMFKAVSRNQLAYALKSVGYKDTTPKPTEGDRVEGLKARSEDGAIIVDFLPLKNATDYYVFVYDANTGKRVHSQKVPDGKYTDKIVNAIKPNTDYIIKICPKVNGKYLETDKNGIGVKARIDFASPDRFEIVSESTNTVTIRWTAIKNADAYWIRIMDNNKNILTTVKSITNEVVLKRLKSGETYFISIQTRVIQQMKNGKTNRIYLGYSEPVELVKK